MNDKQETINISTITLLKIIFAVLLLWFLWVVRDVLLIFLISIIISSAIDPVADFFSQHKIPRILSVSIVYVLFVGLVALAGFLIAPSVTQQFQAIKNGDVYQAFVSRIGLYSESLSHSTIGQAINNSFRDLANNFGGTLFATTKGVLTGIGAVITILVISFYLTVEENGMKNFIKHLAPYKHQAYVMKLITKIQRKMGAWLLGQVILSTVIFGLVFIGLTVLKVQFAMVLALVAALLEIVPLVGPFIGGTIAVFFAFLQSPPLALAVLILWIIILQLEAHIIVPIVMSRSVGINPIMVILAVLVGATLGGIVGALVAIPIAGGISVFIEGIMDSEKFEESEG